MQAHWYLNFRREFAEIADRCGIIGRVTTISPPAIFCPISMLPDIDLDSAIAPGVTTAEEGDERRNNPVIPYHLGNDRHGARVTKSAISLGQSCRTTASRQAAPTQSARSMPCVDLFDGAPDHIG